MAPAAAPAALIACSGGADSVAMAHVVTTSCDRYRPVAVCHVDHRLRAGSERDAELVRRHAIALGLPFVATTVEVKRHGSIEDQARTARWQALRAAAAQYEADVIATGHTADDQAETVLFRLARGAGLTGATGMRPLDGDVWRPVLSRRRHELRELCRTHDWEFLDDPTNVDRSFMRNRIRLDILPALGDRAVPALVRAAQLAADDDDLLDQLACGVALDVRSDGSVAVSLASLQDAHRALGRRIIRRACAAAAPPGAYMPPLVRVEEARAGRALHLGGGFRTRLEGSQLVVEYRSTVTDS